ncbi:MAG: AzlD domain-containing protein, partial [Clostridia bacterium]|nr:AzlD domain-containing protein [Clostridia bacterium]
MVLVTYAIRVLPLTLIRKPIRSQFIQSFLFYVPYVTLAVMTFPAIT